MSFRGGRLRDFHLPTGTVWLLTDIAEHKGKQELFVRQSPHVLKILREMAVIQSAESSNRIEGVTVAPERLKPLVLGNAKPRDRSEEEVRGYRKALDLIHRNGEDIPPAPETLLDLHRLIQEGAGDAGRWKRLDNEIVETRPGKAPLVRFRAVPASRTPSAVEELYRSYRHAVDQEKVPPPVAVAALVFDFLCIHPFRDGNGRVSRLVTLLELYRHGFEVGRYIGLERLVEETKEDYYRVLQDSSRGWHEGRHDILPWLNYFLSVLRRACRELEDRAAQAASPRGAKTGLVRQFVMEQAGHFSLGDVRKAAPGVSREMVKRVLREMAAEGLIKSLGKGRSAAWERV